ncbi:substrate-binding domain-containing protein [Streptomyces cocklensis]|jgi:D-xylose transport system substrate-binding protein|uniref:D-xylose transport system substrate-binding protein n=1 Tax=Actinacidiphila cocklensis TaxID=887465 RepID=A0A9W4E6T7_9ACTN|nr:substrate-binding domain-containing protein [Actinacidiphila cocklensis]MDD1059170.1 substrate-binding domain-containing protein [Actinacidiphila cocklensis]WSX73319.1 substrate-binding domain-containing protein [Streptomyces sp. NBC_00899]WSX80615.1 substrate-binding domain-containing protein [Streptomyces sp. NBC_00899]CAG6394404.1 D-xylose transport system substrate-binding protein [Actinacidiphila cocklensis]
MNAIARRLVVGSAVITLALTMAACGKAGDDKSSSDSTDKTIGLLLPDTVTARYEKFDRPLITNKIKELCSDCTVDYDNAAGDAAKQAQQVSSMIAKGVKVLILDAQDAVGIKSSVQAAVDKGIKVVAYDRLAQGPVSAYVSYDNEKVGELQGQALLDAMGASATPQSKIVMINGDDADPNAAEFKAGAHKILDGKVTVAYEQSGLWKDTVANQKVQAAITSVGKANIKGVYSANDTMAGGIATALKANSMSVPLTGQDADLTAIQRILLGTQSSTVYKAAKPEAENTAQIAVDLLQGKDFKSLADTTKKSGSGNDVPSKLLEAVSVTKANIKDTVVADGTYTAGQICTSDFAAACTEAGIK